MVPVVVAIVGPGHHSLIAVGDGPQFPDFGGH